MLTTTMVFAMLNVTGIKNSLIGEDIYILGNGPSIKDEDLTKLDNKYSIGLNASPLLETEFSFKSQYYVLSDTRFISHPDKRAMATTMLSPGSTRIFRKELYEYDDEKHKSDTYYVNAIGKNGFSLDLALGFYFGCTTTMLAIQVAYYLGCKRIFLLGNDLTYSSKNPRFYKEYIAQEFDRFTSIQIWNIRNSYNILNEHGVQLYNCSKQSLLRPYIPFFKAFND